MRERWQEGRAPSIITSGALILVLVAAAFATSDVIIVKAFGVATAIAILLDATAVRALLVLALVAQALVPQALVLALPISAPVCWTRCPCPLWLSP